MYEKARRGESIELSPRQISIFQFDVERSLNDRLCNCLLALDDTVFEFLCCDIPNSSCQTLKLTSCVIKFYMIFYLMKMEDFVVSYSSG